MAAAIRAMLNPHIIKNKYFRYLPIAGTCQSLQPALRIAISI